MQLLGQLIGTVWEVQAGAASGRDMLNIRNLRTTSQIEASRLYFSHIIHDSLV